MPDGRCATAEAFWSNVNKGDGCWEWTGRKDRDGYGVFWSGSAPVLAHRRAWALSSDVSADGLCVCHTCDNRACCRPDHLFLGTQRENMEDKCRKGRHARGASHGRAKLTSENVERIRADRCAGRTYAEIAAELGMSVRQIARIARGEHWK